MRESKRTGKKRQYFVTRRRVKQCSRLHLLPVRVVWQTRTCYGKSRRDLGGEARCCPDSRGALMSTTPHACFGSHACLAGVSTKHRARRRQQARGVLWLPGREAGTEQHTGWRGAKRRLLSAPGHRRHLHPSHPGVLSS